MRNSSPIPITAVLAVMLAVLACSLPGSLVTSAPPVAGSPTIGSNQPVSPATASVTNTPQSTTTPVVVHVLTPLATVDPGKPVFDVESSGTAAEKRAPYGDSYDINRLERPFSQDMTYIPDLDIETFSLANDQNFYYVSLDLIGVDPNNAIGIHYGVELDTNADGFGDFMVLANGPYTADWSTSNVHVYADSNHDTAGLSGERSDTPVTTDGYDKLIFDGTAGSNTDPDFAWVRISAGQGADVQFAFKKTWAGSSFMYGVIADAGLKDIGKLDYVDRFYEADAGSPIKGKKEYPLKSLYAVDNTCREAYGFKPNGYEPMLCPRNEPNPTKKPPGVPTATPGIIIICLSKGTLIDTPNGTINVEELRRGDIVWTTNESGERTAAPLLRVSHTPVLSGHQVVHILMNDGRELWVSPKHPTADGRLLGELQPGDLLDGGSVTSVALVSYTESATYDLLPAGDTGFYWANGILVGSTLTDQ